MNVTTCIMHYLTKATYKMEDHRKVMRVNMFKDYCYPHGVHVPAFAYEKDDSFEQYPTTRRRDLVACSLCDHPSGKHNLE